MDRKCSTSGLIRVRPFFPMYSPSATTASTPDIWSTFSARKKVRYAKASVSLCSGGGRRE